MAPSGGRSDNDRELFPFIEHTWNNLRDVTEEASFNLKEAMKMLQELDSSDVFGQEESVREESEVPSGSCLTAPCVALHLLGGTQTADACDAKEARSLTENSGRGAATPEHFCE